jgi:S-(hydroxymethyl)glutathione dehydrogenase / alcohol dehydrogenase
MRITYFVGELVMDSYDREIDSADNFVSRRRLFRHGAAVAGGALAAQAARGQAVAPGKSGQSLAGTKFRALVRHDTALTIEELTLRPIQPQQVVIRTQAAQACYTIVSVLNNNPVRNAVIVGHGGVGIVEEIGPEVTRVQVGDRVILAVTPQCGQCWLCLRGRADLCCSGADRPVIPVADMRDGTPVNGDVGGYAELMVQWEEYIVPIFSEVSAEELSLLSCVSACGLGMALKRAPVEPGSDVVVFGAGPVGLSAIQGGRIAGAAQIIAVEPIKYRRELALKVGATTVLDPNVDRGSDLVTKIKGMCKGPAVRAFAGGRGNNFNWGPMFVLEAVGGDRFPPKVEAGPDPTGLEVLQQVWQVCPPGGVIRTCGVGQPRGTNLSFPANQWSNAGKTHMPGNLGGVNPLHDVPMFVRLIESKEFDAKSLVTAIFPLDRAREALQAAADRTTVTGIVTFG